MIAKDFTIQLSPIYDPNNEYPNIQSSDIENNSFVVYGENCKFFWVVQGTRNEIETEPLKTDVEVKGDGPYKYIHLYPPLRKVEPNPLLVKVEQKSL